ncbi:MAG: DnaJ domain-containing protein [Spirochaetes bacterium]|nr:DnaJ domain-containing protein [Spirochaetota bacterium]
MYNALEKPIDYYEILRVQRDVSVDEIKKAYKRLVLIFHPDVCKEKECTEKFKEIVKAYSILKDFDLRVGYDKQLKKNEGFFPKIKFEYCYREFVKKRDALLNSFRILFKNISGKNKTDISKKSKEFFQCQIIVPDEIFLMPLEELEQRLLYSQNVYVRMNAAIAIGYKREKRGFSILEKVIMDPDYEVRKAVIWAMGNLRMKKSLEFLKLLYNSTYSPLRLEILKSIYKITQGKGLLLHGMFIQAFSDDIEELRIGALELFLRTNKKLSYRDVKGSFENISPQIRVLIDRLISENRILNYSY